jgi:hypothetical protein
MSSVRLVRNATWRVRVHQRLKPEPVGQQRRQHDPGVGDRPLVIETDLQPIASDTTGILHHVDDLMTQAAVAPINR